MPLASPNFNFLNLKGILLSIIPGTIHTANEVRVSSPNYQLLYEVVQFALPFEDKVIRINSLPAMSIYSYQKELQRLSKTYWTKNTSNATPIALFDAKFARCVKGIKRYSSYFYCRLSTLQIPR